MYYELVIPVWSGKHTWAVEAEDYKVLGWNESCNSTGNIKQIMTLDMFN